MQSYTDILPTILENCDARTAGVLIIASPTLTRALWQEMKNNCVVSMDVFWTNNYKWIDELHLIIAWQPESFVSIYEDIYNIIVTDDLVYCMRDADDINGRPANINISIRGAIFARYITALKR